MNQDRNVCGTLRQALDFYLNRIASRKLDGQKNPDFAGTKRQVRELLEIKPANEMSLDELIEAFHRLERFEKTMQQASEVRS